MPSSCEKYADCSRLPAGPAAIGVPVDSITVAVAVTGTDGAESVTSTSMDSSAGADVCRIDLFVSSRFEYLTSGAATVSGDALSASARPMSSMCRCGFDFRLNICLILGPATKGYSNLLPPTAARSVGLIATSPSAADGTARGGVGVRDDVVPWGRARRVVIVG